MRMEFELLLPDAPGTLAPVLELVAEHGGNVHSVVHRHEAAEDGDVPVVLAIEVPEDGALQLVGALTNRHRIVRMDQEGGPARTSVLLSGHVFQARIDSMLEAVFDAGAEVDRVDARIAGRDSPSAALVELSARSEAELAAGLAALRQAAADAEIGLLESVEEPHA